MDFEPYSAYIPVYNQAATLGAALASLRAQTVPPAEILVVDDGSTDDSVKIAQAAGATVLLQNRNLGRGAARARAIQVAAHELVLGCDAGNRLPPDFAARALAHFSNAPRLATVHGWFLQSNSGNIVQRWRSRHLFAKPASELQRHSTHVTSGYIIRRSAALAVGNYNVSMRAGEDAELGVRMQAAGWEVWLDPELKVECLSIDSLGKVFERYARWNETTAPPADSRFWRDYLRRCAYAIKVLAWRDVRESDWACVLISLALPHFLAWRARKKAVSANSRLPVIYYVNTYAEPWLERCWRREAVSRAHLWGADALAGAGFTVRPIYSNGSHPVLRGAQWLSKFSAGRLGELAADLAVLRRVRSGDIVYVAAGNLLLVPLAVRCGLLRVRLVAWIYRPSKPFSWRTLRSFPALHWIREGYAGWLALTPHVESWSRQEYPRARVRRLVWSADTEYYPPATGIGNYFAATGVTQRDYATLLAAARQVAFPFVIIGPAELQSQAPANVTWRVRNRDVPHATIDDDQLRELYCGARAILIPLQPDPDDASGLTNLLEALACARPVIMTRTGALDLTPGALGFGFDVAPSDIAGWITALQTLAEDSALAMRFSARAAKLSCDYFNLPRFEQDVVSYFMDLVQNSPEPPPKGVLASLSARPSNAAIVESALPSPTH